MESDGVEGDASNGTLAGNLEAGAWHCASPTSKLNKESLYAGPDTNEG